MEFALLYADAAVATDGRVTGTVPPSRANDELGELRRSFSGLVDRLRGYTTYLESMGSKLSHELRTPLAVVTSSAAPPVSGRMVTSTSTF